MPHSANILKDERLHGSQSLNTLRVDLTTSHPKSGLIQLDWNLTGTLLLARFGECLAVRLASSPLWHPKENVPNAIFLFDFPSAGETSLPKLRTVLLHSQPVLQARWNPVRRGSLCLCCGIQSVYIWSDEWQGESGEEEEMAECIGVPASRSSFLELGHSLIILFLCSEMFETKDLRWAPDGKGFILLGKDQFCCAFEVSDTDDIEDGINTV